MSPWCDSYTSGVLCRQIMCRRARCARQFHNDAVTALHTKIESFPSNLIAGPFGFAKREYYESEGDARGPVQVDF